MSRLERDRQAALAASEAAQRKQKQVNAQEGHTPGPWGCGHRKQSDGMWCTEVFCGQGETIAAVAWYPKPEIGGVTATYREANARLIASAPELLSALKDCREALLRAGAVGELAVVNAAIKKAQGDTQ